MPTLTLRTLLLRITSASRAQEYVDLRSRFSAHREKFSEEERQLSATLQLQKKALSGLFGEVSSCSRCNHEHPRPEGPWAGGYCCSTSTFNVFDDDEIAVLSAANSTPRQMHPPREDQHGCLFRGHLGCSLSVEQRPAICVRYVCATLEAELKKQGKLAAIKEAERKLKETFERFVKIRARRREDEEFEARIKEG
jgi:hypothetical protein